MIDPDKVIIHYRRWITPRSWTMIDVKVSCGVYLAVGETNRWTGNRTLVSCDNCRRTHEWLEPKGPF